MHPAQFLRTLYFGDRACRSIAIDGFAARVVITVDRISRVNPKTGQWDYYDAEDIENGQIVLSDVEWVLFEPPGVFPNDLINDVTVEEKIAPTSASKAPLFVFAFFVNHIKPGGDKPEGVEMKITIHARAIHLEDPRRPGMRITE